MDVAVETSFEGNQIAASLGGTKIVVNRRDKFHSAQANIDLKLGMRNQLEEN